MLRVFCWILLRLKTRNRSLKARYKISGESAIVQSLHIMHDKLAYLRCDVCYAWKDGLTKRWLSWKLRLFEAVAAKITRIPNRTRQAKLAKIIRVALGGEKCQPVVTFCSTEAYQVYPGVVGREDLAIKIGIYIGRCQLSLLLFVCFFFLLVCLLL